MKLPLHKGADVNVQGGTDGNALQAAAYGGHVEVVNLLVADANAHGERYVGIVPRRTQVASAKGKSDIDAAA